jgi:hypothetical protein
MDRHTLLMVEAVQVARSSDRCSQEHCYGEVLRGSARVMGSEVRPVFFLNPCGWGSETGQKASNFGVLG